MQLATPATDQARCVDEDVPSQIDTSSTPAGVAGAACALDRPPRPGPFIHFHGRMIKQQLNGELVSPRPIKPQTNPDHARLYFLRRASLCGQAKSPDHQYSALLLLNIPAISPHARDGRTRRLLHANGELSPSCQAPISWVVAASHRPHRTIFTFQRSAPPMFWPLKAWNLCQTGSISVPLPKSSATGISRLSLSQPCDGKTSTSPSSPSDVLFVKQRALPVVCNQWFLDRHGL